MTSTMPSGVVRDALSGNGDEREVGDDDEPS